MKTDEDHINTGGTIVGLAYYIFLENVQIIYENMYRIITNII